MSCRCKLCVKCKSVCKTDKKIEWIFNKKCGRIRQESETGEREKMNALNKCIMAIGGEFAKKCIEEAERYAEVVKEMNKPKCHMVAPDGKQWIDLELYNLPDRFYTRDDMEIEYKFPGSKEWEKDINELEHKQYIRYDIIKNNAVYRYRIIEKKETIKIKSLVMQPDGVMKAIKEDGTILLLELEVRSNTQDDTIKK